MVGQCGQERHLAQREVIGLAPIDDEDPVGIVTADDGGGQGGLQTQSRRGLRCVGGVVLQPLGELTSPQRLSILEHAPGQSLPGLDQDVGDSLDGHPGRAVGNEAVSTLVVARTHNG